MAFVSRGVAALTTLTSAYALCYSGMSIPKLQKYEEKAQKAANWSNIAEKRLWDTRYTVGTGFITAAISVLTSGFYAGYAFSGPGFLIISFPLCMAAGAYSACQYMRSFWGSKAKIPLMDEYNEAISDTSNVISSLNLVAGAWGLIALLKGLNL